MSNHCPHADAPAFSHGTRQRGICENALVGLVLLTLVRTGEALAGDQTVSAGPVAKPNTTPARQPIAYSMSMVAVPAPYRMLEIPEPQRYSAEDFRPRGRSTTEQSAQNGAADDAPMLGGTTVWQRLAEFRSRDRVRVVTLWESTGSSVSLQAGKRGSPSLQWTSRFMNHGGATRGVLDQLFSTTPGVTGRGLHLGPHGTATEAAAKPGHLLDALGGSGPGNK